MSLFLVGIPCRYSLSLFLVGIPCRLFLVVIPFRFFLSLFRIGIFLGILLTVFPFRYLLSIFPVGIHLSTFLVAEYPLWVITPTPFNLQNRELLYLNSRPCNPVGHKVWMKDIENVYVNLSPRPWTTHTLGGIICIFYLYEVVNKISSFTPKRSPRISFENGPKKDYLGLNF